MRTVAISRTCSAKPSTCSQRRWRSSSARMRTRSIASAMRGEGENGRSQRSARSERHAARLHAAVEPGTLLALPPDPAFAPPSVGWHHTHSSSDSGDHVTPELKGKSIMATGTVRLHRVLSAKAERVYRAFIDPDAMAKWL